MNWTSTISVLTAVISAGAALVAVWHAARSFKGSAELQAFLTLTDRYECIMSGFPASARVADDWAEELDQDMTLRLRYLNLCSEEFYLKDRKLLSDAVWGIWDAEMKSTLATPPYIRAWPKLAPQFDSYPAFSQFVEAAQRDGGGTRTRRSASGGGRGQPLSTQNNTPAHES